MKSLLLASTPVSSRRQRASELRGSRGHDLAWLRERVREAGVAPPPDKVASDLVFVSSWSTDLRYEPGPGSRGEAERFVAATERIVKWIDERT